MELDPKSLLRQLSDVGLGVAKSFESERAVGFVKALISSMDKTVKAIDKYLKKGKDALEKGKDIAKSKGKGLLDLAKSKHAEVKDTGLLATAKKTAQDTTGKFKDMFASDTEKANGPPEDEGASGGIRAFVKNKVSRFKNNRNDARLTDEDKERLLARVNELLDEYSQKSGKSASIPESFKVYRKVMAEEKTRKKEKSSKQVNTDQSDISGMDSPAKEAKPSPKRLDKVINFVKEKGSTKLADVMGYLKSKDAEPSTNVPKTRLEVVLAELNITRQEFDEMVGKLADSPTADFKKYIQNYFSQLTPRPTSQQAINLVPAKIEEYVVIQLEELLGKKNNSLFGKLKSSMARLADEVLSGSKPNILTQGVKALFKGKGKEKDKDKNADKETPDEDKDKKEDKKRSSFMASFTKQKERMGARKKEVDAEKEGAKTKDKAKGKGPLGMIISAIGSLGGVFASVIGKGIGKLMFFLPKLMLKGMGGLLTRLIPSLAGLIAPGAASAIGSVAGGVATAVGGAALSAVGTAAGAVVGAVFSPIGLGVIAVGATLYAGYKLYKYLNRNELGGGLAGKLTKLRMLTYGYNDVVKEHYNKVLDMDMLVKNYVSSKDGKAVYKKFDATFKKKILEVFSIARTDKVKYELLNTWFIKRYVPAHASFMNAYYAAGGKDYVDDLDKLTPEQMFKFMANYRVAVEIYDQKSIPVFEAPDCTVSKADVDALIVEITQQAKESIDKEKDKKAGVAAKKPSRTEENKAYDKAGVDASDKKFTRPKELAEAAKEIPGAVDPSDKKFLTPKELEAPTEGLPDPSDRKFSKTKEPLTGNEEGEKPPPASEEKAVKEEKPLQSTVDKVAKAPGPLKTGGSDLVGIKSKVATEKIQNLDPNVLNLLSGMTKEYSELTGKSITVNEAFRTRQDQEALKASKGAGAAAPGTSLHEFGIAVDIASTDADTLDKMGLMRKYGFTRPIGGETWHIEPAGVSLNPGGSKSDPQERAKNILSSPGRGGGGLGANRGLPSSMKYKRDMALQKTLFNSGESIESPVEVADLKKDTAVATGPIVDSKPVKDTTSGGMMKTSFTANDPTKMLQPKLEGLDATKEPKAAEGPQLTKALYRPAVQDKKIYSDYSEAEKPPKESANKPTDEANANLGPKEAILKASQVVGVDYNKLLTFAKLESSLKSGVQSAASTATGLFQIVGDTWRDLLKRFGPKYNIPADAQPTNAYYNSVLGACYAKENMGKMEKYKDSGIRQDILTYLAHHFGPEGGERIVKAFMKTPDSPMQLHVSEKAYTSNIQVLANKTVRQYIDSLIAKFNKAGLTEYADKAKSPQEPSTPTAAPKETYTRKSPVGMGPYDKEPSNPLPVEKYVSKGLNFSDTTSAEKNEMDAKLAAVRQKQALAAEKENAPFVISRGVWPAAVETSTRKAEQEAKDKAAKPAEAYTPKWPNRDEALNGSSKDKLPVKDMSVKPEERPTYRQQMPEYLSRPALHMTEKEKAEVIKGMQAHDLEEKARYKKMDENIARERLQAKIDAEDKEAEAAVAKTTLPVKELAAKTQEAPMYRQQMSQELSRPGLNMTQAEKQAEAKAQAAFSAANPKTSWADMVGYKPQTPTVDSTEDMRRFRAQMSAVDKVYGDDHDYSGGQAKPMPVEQAVNKPDYPMTVSKQPMQRAGSNFGNSILDKLNAKLNSRANTAIGGINGVIGNATGQVNGMMVGINGVFNNISKGINDTTSIFSKSMNPASMMDAARQIIPQQPSAAMSLDKTESLLTNMGDTLTQIKVILQSISDKGSMMPAQASASEAKTQTKEAPQPKEPIRAPNYNAPSTEGVSMSRRSVLM